MSESGAVISNLGEHSGGELDAESREAQHHFSDRVLRENFLHRLGEVVGRSTGGLKLDEEGEHLLAECVLDERRLVSVFGAEDLAEPLGLSFDAPLAADLPEDAGEPLGSSWPTGQGVRA
ncbi:hypothetical protein H4N64_43370 [Streptomyces sp. PSKA01]|uniref:Uncharacterized protein n=1 Tax=Streptomyces cupreus TaxID=2759956 RepID=A0A7X1JHT7_9ACTN|nr:hypothetical protein [Streptomyces cupreus]